MAFELAKVSQVELDDDVILKLAHTACAVLNPMAAMFGGIVGQEVVKAVSGKFHPLVQWFYFDSIESMPSEFPLSTEELDLSGGRYDHQIVVFGKRCVIYCFMCQTVQLYQMSIDA